ncbi:XVIPCD domain-containing protein [Luteimonas aquatica]|uniref:XVIPCD domain-containing protein n=1 Tax=Luteimonas aquatica TaxID=450364 RepID=UPI001F56A318|nr:XVIPCD domain-containing protein [Luteimonas aquatica]
MAKYSIEARLYRVQELSVSHTYWLLRDLSTGVPIAELHGLITDRGTGAALQFGLDAGGGHALQAWHYIHAPVEGLWMAPERTEFNDSALYWEGQKAVALFVGDAAEALLRWNSAAAILPLLNRQDLDYPARGEDGVDDNSLYATLGDIMGVQPHVFEDGDAPGTAHRMLDARQIEAFRFRFEGPREDVEAPPAPAEAPSAPAPSRPAAFDPTNPTHPDHPLYKQSLAAVHKLDASLGRTSDEASERLAASMLLLAKQVGLERIDHVILSIKTDYVSRGQNVFVVQNDYHSWLHRRAHIDTGAAVATPAAETFRKLEALAAH